MCNCIHDASRHIGGMCWSLINNGWCPCPGTSVTFRTPGDADAPA